MVCVRSPAYFYNLHRTYNFSRAVPVDLRHRFTKRKINVSLRSKAESKAARSAAALSDRLERYWDSLRIKPDHDINEIEDTRYNGLLLGGLP